MTHNHVRDIENAWIAAYHDYWLLSYDHLACPKCQHKTWGDWCPRCGWEYNRPLDDVVPDAPTPYPVRTYGVFLCTKCGRQGIRVSPTQQMHHECAKRPVGIVRGPRGTYRARRKRGH